MNNKDELMLYALSGLMESLSSQVDQHSDLISEKSGNDSLDENGAQEKDSLQAIFYKILRNKPILSYPYECDFINPTEGNDQYRILRSASDNLKAIFNKLSGFGTDGLLIQDVLLRMPMSKALRYLSIQSLAESMNHLHSRGFRQSYNEESHLAVYRHARKRAFLIGKDPIAADLSLGYCDMDSQLKVYNYHLRSLLSDYPDLLSGKFKWIMPFYIFPGDALKSPHTKPETIEELLSIFDEFTYPDKASFSEYFDILSTTITRVLLDTNNLRSLDGDNRINKIANDTHPEIAEKNPLLFYRTRILIRIDRLVDKVVDLSQNPLFNEDDIYDDIKPVLKYPGYSLSGFATKIMRYLNDEGLSVSEKVSFVTDYLAFLRDKKGYDLHASMPANKSGDSPPSIIDSVTKTFSGFRDDIRSEFEHQIFMLERDNIKAAESAEKSDVVNQFTI